MNKETYEQHKETLAAGKIVISSGRTAATLAQLQELARIEGGILFGTDAKENEVMAIDSGRLKPEEIAEMGEDHPLIVASRRLTESQMNALFNYFQEALAPPPSEQDEPKLSKPEVPAGNAVGSQEATEQAVQAQIGTGANDALTPKAVLDNKTNAEVPAGKNASKTQADAAQDAEKAGAKTAAA